MKMRIASMPVFAGKLPPILLLAALATAMLFSGCAAPASPDKAAEIKIAILPIVDALPFYVAEKQGYFTANGVAVTFIPAASAAERDQLIAAGQADGMINDLVSVALYNRQDVQVQTVRFALSASRNAAMFSILASKESGLTAASDLENIPIGMSQGTVIDYVTTRLLEREGLAAEQIQSIAVPKLSERLTLLGSGELKAATLPEPFGTIAQQSGAVLLVSDAEYPEYGYSVISFRKAFIDKNPKAVEGFLKAFEQAADDINQQPEQWRALLGENKLVPEALQATYPMPVFQAAAVPSEAQFNDVIEWMIARKLIETDGFAGGQYADSITAQYLPK